MKKNILIIILLISYIHPAITSYNTIKSFNKITLSLNLDKPFTGKISKSEIDNNIIIKIPDTLKIKEKIHNMNSDIISSIIFSYSNNSSKVKIIKNKQTNKLIIEVEKSFDAKIVLISISPDLVSSLFNNTNTINNQLPPPSPTIGIGSYLFAISLIAILLVIYFMAKRKTNESLKLNNLKGYKLIFVRQIDLKTKLIVFELNEKRYIVMSGSNFATLIDRVEGDDTKDNFDSYLQQAEDIKKDELKGTSINTK